MIILGVGTYYLIKDNPHDLNPSELNAIRDRVKTGSLLLLILMVAVAYEGGYLFKNQLFQRFLLNGYTRWHWANFLVLNILAISITLAVCQTLFINITALIMYDVYWLLNWGHILKLVIAYLFSSLFSLFWVVLFPKFIALIIVLGWVVLETIISEMIIKKFFAFLYPVLPFPSLFDWLESPLIQNSSAILVISYFILFLINIYALINKRIYAL